MSITQFVPLISIVYSLFIILLLSYFIFVMNQKKKPWYKHLSLPDYVIILLIFNCIFHFILFPFRFSYDCTSTTLSNDLISIIHLFYLIAISLILYFFFTTQYIPNIPRLLLRKVFTITNLIVLANTIFFVLLQIIIKGNKTIAIVESFLLIFITISGSIVLVTYLFIFYKKERSYVEVKLQYTDEDYFKRAFIFALSFIFLNVISLILWNLSFFYVQYCLFFTTLFYIVDIFMLTSIFFLIIYAKLLSKIKKPKKKRKKSLRHNIIRSISDADSMMSTSDSGDGNSDSGSFFGPIKRLGTATIPLPTRKSKIKEGIPEETSIDLNKHGIFDKIIKLYKHFDGAIIIWLLLLNTALALTSNEYDFSGWKVASCMPDCFCEKIQRGTIKQPINTWTNFGFVLVGLLCYWQSGYDVKELHQNRITTLRIYPILFAISLVLLGLGSTFYHASLTFIGQYIDIMGMYMLGSFILLYGSLPFSQVYRQNWILRILVQNKYAIIAFFLINIGIDSLQIFVASLRRYIFILILTSATLVLLLYRFPMQYYIKQLNRVQAKDRYLFLCLFIYGTSTIFWILDSTGTLCDPSGIFQGHLVWHIGGAIAAGFLFLYYRSETIIEVDSTEEQIEPFHIYVEQGPYAAIQIREQMVNIPPQTPIIAHISKSHNRRNRSRDYGVMLSQVHDHYSDISEIDIDKYSRGPTIPAFTEDPKIDPFLKTFHSVGVSSRRHRSRSLTQDEIKQRMMGHRRCASSDVRQSMPNLPLLGKSSPKTKHDRTLSTELDSSISKIAGGLRATKSPRQQRPFSLPPNPNFHLKLPRRSTGRLSISSKNTSINKITPSITSPTSPREKKVHRKSVTEKLLGFVSGENENPSLLTTPSELDVEEMKDYNPPPIKSRHHRSKTFSYDVSQLLVPKDEIYSSIEAPDIGSMFSSINKNTSSRIHHSRSKTSDVGYAVEKLIQKERRGRHRRTPSIQEFHNLKHI